MARRAFTVIEIIVVIFLILMVASIFIPLNIANVKQAELVARWKNTFEESKYSFELLRVQNPMLFRSIKMNENVDSTQVFESIKKYLDMDDEKSTPVYFSNYKYKFLNGRKVKKNSKLYVKDFVTLRSGVIIGFKLNEKRLVYGNTAVGILLFDVNGLEKPNRIGKDIFGVNVYRNDIKPFGEGRSLSSMTVNCSPIGTGVMCSKYYLIGGKF